MIYILLGILGWLLSGFSSFVILAKAVGYTKVDEEVKETLLTCLLGGFVILIFIPIALFFMFM